ncbi:MAG: hypothetical protein DRN06_07400 [Thermoprotei archaeon]|nr:MAG: hypothetical protein DRN06_07400 [Thermoprotei archaeon]
MSKESVELASCRRSRLQVREHSRYPIYGYADRRNRFAGRPSSVGGAASLLTLKVEWLSQTLDILPTVLDIVGVGDEGYWRSLQGYSLLLTLTEGSLVRDFALIKCHTSVQQLFHTWRRYSEYDTRRFNY